MEGFLGETKEERITVVDTGGDKAMYKNRGGEGGEGGTAAVRRWGRICSHRCIKDIVCLSASVACMWILVLLWVWVWMSVLVSVYGYLYFAVLCFRDLCFVERS